MPRLSVVIASTRPDRIGHRVAHWVLERVPADFETTVHDLRELNLPFLDEPGQPADGNYAHEHTRRWSAAMRRPTPSCSSCRSTTAATTRR